MEPFEPDDLSDRELDEILRQWESPEPPARLRTALFPETARPWWQRMWGTSIHIPVPLGAALVTAAVALAVWRWPSPPVAPPTRIERVEVPVMQERIVTVYRDRPSAPAVDLQKLQPVAELRPVILRRNHAQN